MSDMTTELMQARLRQQAGRIAELEEELRQVRQMLISSVQLPRWVPYLSRSEETVLRHFLARDTVTIEGLRYALYQGQARDEHICHVWICRLRKKLKPTGVTIDVEWGRAAYSMPKEFRDLICDPLSVSPVQSAGPIGGADHDHQGIATAGAGV